MATIIIKRTSEFVNRLRNYRIFLDGEKIGTIANGETKEFEITPGLHTIIAKIDWCTSPEISVTLSDSEKKELTVGGFKNGKWIMPVGLAIIVITYFLQAEYNIKYGAIAVFPFFAVLVYYISIGRKKYLTLTE